MRDEIKKFQSGDLVILKSEEYYDKKPPVMVVETPGSTPSCIWWDGVEFQRDTFEAEILKQVDEE